MLVTSVVRFSAWTKVHSDEFQVKAEHEGEVKHKPAHSIRLLTNDVTKKDITLRNSENGDNTRNHFRQLAYTN